MFHIVNITIHWKKASRTECSNKSAWRRPGFKIHIPASAYFHIRAYKNPKSKSYIWAGFIISDLDIYLQPMTSDIVYFLCFFGITACFGRWSEWWYRIHFLYTSDTACSVFVYWHQHARDTLNSCNHTKHNFDFNRKSRFRGVEGKIEIAISERPMNASFLVHTLYATNVWCMDLYIALRFLWKSSSSFESNDNIYFCL